MWRLSVFGSLSLNLSLELTRLWPPAGDYRRLPACRSQWRAAVFLLQQQERAVGLPHREGLHEGDGWLWLSRIQLGEWTQETRRGILVPIRRQDEKSFKLCFSWREPQTTGCGKCLSCLTEHWSARTHWLDSWTHRHALRQSFLQ